MNKLNALAINREREKMWNEHERFTGSKGELD